MAADHVAGRPAHRQAQGRLPQAAPEAEEATAGIGVLPADEEGQPVELLGADEGRGPGRSRTSMPALRRGERSRGS